MQRIWVLGAGKFGRISVEALLKGRRKVEMTVVDSEGRCLEQMADLPVTTVLDDGIDFLVRHLTRREPPDWIIPVIPVHVAAEWICARLGKGGPARLLPVPDALAGRLPNPMRGAKGEVYASLAGFVCPEDCPQPANYCFHTQKPRPCNLYDRLAAIAHEGCRSLVVVSRQLAPGVGGIAPRELFQTLEKAAAQHTPFLLSTACRCHAVVSAIEFEKEGRC